MLRTLQSLIIKQKNDEKNTHNAGDIIDIPEGAKHWHGATKDSWFQHLATHVHVGEPESNEWLEPVTDEQYNEANLQYRKQKAQVDISNSF